MRSRERTVKELEEHLRTALSMLAKKDVTIAGLESDLAVARQETEEHRRRLAILIQRAVTRHRRASPKRAARPKKAVRPTKRRTVKKVGPRQPSKRR
jgi:septal ring factor EnvC (AmiA/AmiB activator)